MMLRVENLSYQYGANPVLSNLSLELSNGTLAALVGRNGAGKSTLLRCLAGWTIPLTGSIEIDGRALRRSDKAVRDRVVLVPDTPDFYDELTAWDHLQLVSQLYRVDQWQERSRALLEQFQLFDERFAFPFTFSRGMRYKLALIMALVIQPPLLLLDEPFGPLDSPASRLLWDHLQQYRALGKTTLFSSHILPDEGRPDVLLLLDHQQITSFDGGQITHLADVFDER